MSVKLGNVQLKIMRVLWKHGETTARVVTDELSKTSPIAHSTVQTLLRKLVAKKAVDHVERDRTFYFRPLLSESELSQSAAQDFVERVFRGSISGLVANLLEAEQVTDQELARLRELVNENAKESK
ncbi:MAG: BlaI/MecI/CopY family transcriptional regulator [Fimbriimonadaceae bacterium]